MKTIKLIRLAFALLLALLAVAACGGAPMGTSAAVLPTATLTMATFPAATNTPAPVPSATPTPTDTLTPTSTATDTPSPTVTPTPIPTIQVGNLVLPDPRYTNTKLFDLDDPDAPVPQFVNAMQMAGIQVDAEQVRTALFQNLEVREGLGGIPYVLAAYAVTDKSGTVYAMGLIAEKQDNGEFEWDRLRLRHASLFVADLTIGSALTPETEQQFFAEFNYAPLHVQFDVDPASAQPVRYNWPRTQANLLKGNPTLKGIRLHHLIDAGALAPWIEARELSFEQLQALLTDLVRTGMLTFPEATSFIVVNEPYISPDRPSDPFYSLLGGYDYIETAFQIARETRPDAELIYNDSQNHSLDDPVEKGFTTSLTKMIVERLKQRDLIDAVGMQMHVRAGNPPFKDDIIKTMRYYGLPVYLTEVDVNLKDLRPEDPDRWSLQASIYHDIVTACLESGVCRGLVFWDLGDESSWYEVNQGQDNADPTLFRGTEASNYPKPAYYAVLQTLLGLGQNR